MCRQIWMIRPHPAQVHAFGADLAEYRQRPPDVGNAGVEHFLLTQRLRCHQRQEETLAIYGAVVEPPDEMPGQLLLAGLLGDHRLPRPAEFVDEAGEG